MLFSWRKFLAGPMVKNAVQKDPWNPWEHTEFLQHGPGKMTFPNPAMTSAGASLTHNFKECFFRVGRERT